MEEKIKAYRKNGFPKIWESDLQNGKYKNPILHVDYSDPDIIKVNDDFFMTASSFSNVPGLPILHSKDLVNWNLVSYALEKLPFEKYNTPQYGKGCWAPALRFYNGWYYIYVGFPDEGIIMVRTKNPFGKWEEPVILKEVKGFIDTCPFWDEDGQGYLINAFANSRIGFKSILAIHKMNEDGTKLIDDFRIVYDGNEKNPTIEGPKMYKRNGYYYISAPAGGVTFGWQLILRSKNIYGPYEEKIVLHQGDSEINGPHQGGWVDLENESWFMHFQDLHAYGRIVHLQPMKWIDDWPAIGIDTNNDSIGEPVLEYKMPVIIKNQEIKNQTSDDFLNSLGLQWQWNGNPKNDWYNLNEKSFLTLNCVNDFYNNPEKIGYMPNILTQKFPSRKFVAYCKVEFNPKNIGDKIGLIILGKEYSGLQLIKGTNKIFINRVFGTMEKNITEYVTHGNEINSNTIYFKINLDENAVCNFYYSLDGKDFIKLGEEFIAKPNIWVGGKLGLFASGEKNNKDLGFGKFDWILFDKE